jgi:2-methylcitrate dehydratase PrpD
MSLPAVSVAQKLARRIAALRAASLPPAVVRKCEDLAVDVTGLCIAARNEDYVRAAFAACDDEGPCTAIGHARTLSAAAAALVNGTAAHGEDFDDTFEGGPVHAGAVIVPAVLAACERHGKHGPAALLGIAVGCEVMCRLSTVIPKAVHKAGFHPTAIFGAVGAAAGVGVALGLDERQLVDALGISASMASGIIEYLAEGAWTKRMHAGWAAQSGLRAALLGREGFAGPRTVFEGVHGLFHGFARSAQGNFGALDDFGQRWVIETLAFKPYPCGTMAHPFIDCAKKLKAQGAQARGYQGNGVRDGGRHCASSLGTARRQAEAAERLCREVLDSLSACHRLRARRRRFRAFHGRSDWRPPGARGRGQGQIRCRSRQSLSRRLYRPHPRHAERWPGRRGAAAAFSRRRQ